MNDSLKNILIGAGSAIALMPAGSVQSIQAPQKTDAEKLQGDWNRVGKDLYFASGNSVHGKARDSKKEKG